MRRALQMVTTLAWAIGLGAAIVPIVQYVVAATCRFGPWISYIFVGIVITILFVVTGRIWAWTLGQIAKRFAA